MVLLLLRHEVWRVVVVVAAALLVMGVDVHVRAFSRDLVATSVVRSTLGSRSSITRCLAVSADNAVHQRTLFDVPVSNNGARCRIIVYKKNIESMIQIVPPISLGGLRSEAYLRRNPQGKMPMLIIEKNNEAKMIKDTKDDDDEEDGNLNMAESDTVARFLLREYAAHGPSFLPNNPRSNLIARFHDMYLSTIQGCLYKPAPPFGVFGSRKDAIAEFCKQLGIIDDLVLVGKTQISKDGLSKAMYLCGSKVSLADATLFPTAVFASYMLPKFGVNPPLPPKLTKWYDNMLAFDEDFRRVHDEIIGGLAIWESNHRWDPLLGAGWRDVEPATLFDKILSGEIPAAVVEQPDNAILCFKDINPVAPAHVLIIPKDRNGMTRLRKVTAEHTDIMGRLMVAAATISRNETLGFGDGARIVINDGPDGGQEVMHLHVHVLGGRKFDWPPG